MPPHLTKRAAFEGLFKNLLRADGPFKHELKQAGYDIDNPKEIYPCEVYTVCVEIAARHVFPKLTPEQAYRCLGRTFIEGYFKTISGRLIAAALPLIGPDRTMMRSPQNLTHSSEGVDISVVKEGTAHYTLTFRMSHVGHAEFVAGALEESLARTKCKPTVTLKNVHVHGYQLDVRW